MGRIQLQGQTPLPIGELNDTDRIMVVDQNDTVVAITTLAIIREYFHMGLEISDISMLQDELDGKANVDHQHVIGDVVNLQASLDEKLDASLVNIVGRTIHIKGETITVPQAVGGGGSDDRIPSPVTSGNFLRFIGTDGSIEDKYFLQNKVICLHNRRS